MCLFVPKDGKIEIAKKDIKVYKAVLNLDDETCWRSIFFFTPFHYNKVETAMDGRYPIEHLYIDCRGCINEGFHSVLKIDDVVFGEVKNIRICIIPKGSEYCIGRDGDVVSVKLIVFETLFDYVFFKLKGIWQDTIGRLGGI